MRERVLGLNESLVKLNKKPFLSTEENKAYTEIEKMLNFNQRLEQVLSLCSSLARAICKLILSTCR